MKKSQLLQANGGPEAREEAPEAQLKRPDK
jgi:hypothetical protein